MLLQGLSRLPWPLRCVLFAAVATATISPSNSSTANARFQGTIPLRLSGDANQIAGLIPLTRQAASQNIDGNLYVTNFSSVANISDSEIAYISCNPNDYPGNVDAQRVFDDAYQNAKISGVILYSTDTDYCNYEQATGQASMQGFPILSMTSKQDSATVLDSAVNSPPQMKYFVQVQANSASSSAFGSQQNPLGPTPSTAVAMIILYAITGCITGLFLIIIITGAIRAHRHPERYGPRNVLGRPRQSRARGLGRAILDTIPIVKFGEKEPEKPTDVELGSGSETRDVDGGTGVPTTTEVAEPTKTEGTPTVAATAPNTSPTATEHASGIAPAQSLAEGVGAAKNIDTNNNEDSSLGCSICTEDFENGQDIRVLPCDHKFHPDCVDPWLLNVSGTCPLCRVDLRPVTSRDSTSTDPDAAALAPPLNPDPESTSSRRRSAFRDILSLRQRPNASAEERISALRRLREQRVANASTDDVGRNRRSRRMSARLGDVFSGRTRRVSPGRLPPPQQQQQRDGETGVSEQRE